MYELEPYCAEIVLVEFPRKQNYTKQYESGRRCLPILHCVPDFFPLHRKVGIMTDSRNLFAICIEERLF